MTDRGADPAAATQRSATPPPRTPEERSAQKKLEARALQDGFIGAVLAFAIALAAGIPAGGGVAGMNMATLGSIAAMLGMFAALVTGAGAYRRRLTLRLGNTLIGAGLAIATVGPFLAIVGLGARAVGAQLEAGDRAPLLRGADTLRHPSLGFQLGDPGPAYIETEIPSSVSQRLGPGGHVYSYTRDDGTGAALTVTLRNDIGSSRDFRDYVGALRDSMQSDDFRLVGERIDVHAMDATFDVDARGVPGRVRTIVVSSGGRHVAVTATGIGTAARVAVDRLRARALAHEREP